MIKKINKKKKKIGCLTYIILFFIFIFIISLITHEDKTSSLENSNIEKKTK